jgi:hypothetical protein
MAVDPTTGARIIDRLAGYETLLNRVNDRVARRMLARGIKFWDDDSIRQLHALTDRLYRRYYNARVKRAMNSPAYVRWMCARAAEGLAKPRRKGNRGGRYRPTCLK